MGVMSDYAWGATTNCKVRNGQTRTEYQCRFGWKVTNQYIENGIGYSTIDFILQVRSINSSYTTTGTGQTTKIDGVTVASNQHFSMASTNTWQTFGTRTVTVAHDGNGNYSAVHGGECTSTAGSANYSLQSGSANATVTPDHIQLTKGHVMIKDTSGIVRRCPHVRAKEMNGTVHDIRYIMMKDFQGTIHEIKLY